MCARVRMCIMLVYMCACDDKTSKREMCNGRRKQDHCVKVVSLYESSHTFTHTHTRALNVRTRCTSTHGLRKCVIALWSYEIIKMCITYALRVCVSKLYHCCR